jgi:hypothetical protein
MIVKHEILCKLFTLIQPKLFGDIREFIQISSATNQLSSVVVCINDLQLLIDESWKENDRGSVRHREQDVGLCWPDDTAVSVAVNELDVR